MVVHVETKDVQQLTDIEAGDFGDLVFRSADWSVGFLTKEAEEWSLVSTVTQSDELAGFAYASLERIGGTPAVLFGLVSTAGSQDPASILDALESEYLERARISFPDEDVVVAARCTQRSHLQLFAGLSDVCPVGGLRVGGEERAWGQRLAKRFQAKEFDRRTMIMSGHTDSPCFDSLSDGPESLRSISSFDSTRFDSLSENEQLIVWGWAPAEYLSSHTPRVAV